MLIKFLDGSSREIADLRGADLRGANLRGVNLRGADLSDANLRRANLRRADLSDANLRVANLRDAGLFGADLRGAYLSGAYLSGADLCDADLRGANLYGADLSDANLGDADLRGADLRGADLSDAYLSGAYLSGAKGLEQRSILPEGELIGYKKLADGTIAELRIPAAAKRVNAYSSRKCRAEYAFVLSSSGASAKHAETFKYPKRGKIVPDSYDADPRVECSHGIHFFITEQEAKDY